LPSIEQLREFAQNSLDLVTPYFTPERGVVYAPAPYINNSVTHHHHYNDRSDGAYRSGISKSEKKKDEEKDNSAAILAGLACLAVGVIGAAAEVTTLHARTKTLSKTNLMDQSVQKGFPQELKHAPNLQQCFRDLVQAKTAVDKQLYQSIKRRMTIYTGLILGGAVLAGGTIKNSEYLPTIGTVTLVASTLFGIGFLIADRSRNSSFKVDCAAVERLSRQFLEGSEQRQLHLLQPIAQAPIAPALPAPLLPAATLQAKEGRLEKDITKQRQSVEGSSRQPTAFAVAGATTPEAMKALRKKEN